MAIKENVSFRKNPVTSVLGLLLVLIATAVFVAPYFYDVKQEVNILAIAALGAVGLLLLLSPDKLVGIIEKKAE